MTDDSVYNDPTKLHTTKSGVVPPVIVEKPWGGEELLVACPDYAMKFLKITAGERLSVQYHNKKRETLHCLSGEGVAFLGTPEDPENLEKIPFTPGTTLHIEPRTVHTYEATKDMVIVEVSTPHIDDVVRLQDRYGRS